MDVTELQKALLEDDFDVEKHASNLLQSSLDIGKYISDLKQAEKDLDVKLEDHVSSHHNDLLSQATSVERLETHLSTVSEQSATLMSSVERLRARINEPYESIRTQTVTLSRLQKTCDLLRRIIRILQLSKKLQAQLQGGPSEITKAALSLSELAELWHPEEELSGIEIIEQDQRILLHARNEVERNADAMLTTGMESKSQNQMGIALQVYFNLDLLSTKIDQVLNRIIKAVKVKSNESLDARNINRKIMEEQQEQSQQSNMPNSSLGGGENKSAVPGKSLRSVSFQASSQNMAAFRSLLWSNIESLLDFVFTKCCEAMQLQKILVKKKDNVLGTAFIDLLSVEEKRRSIVNLIWHEILNVLKLSFHQASADSSTIKQTLEGEFPKLLRLFNELWSRLVQSWQSSQTISGISSGGMDVILINPFEKSNENQLREVVLVAFERQYLSLSLSRLFDPVNLMFAAHGSTPNTEELEQVFKAINSEINIANVDKGLASAVAKNVAKTVTLMCNKSEQMLDLDGQASQVVGYPTDEQRKNVKVVNCLFAFYVGIESQFQTFGIASNPGGLADVESLIRTAIDPLINSIKDAIEAILLTMHNEDFTKNEDATTKSPYMKELAGFLSRVNVDFLSKFHCKTLVGECCFSLAEKSVDMFILHASLVRPVSQAGQKRLAGDCDQILVSLEPITSLVAAWDRSAMDKTGQKLAAFKQLVLMNAEDMAGWNFKEETGLSASTVLHVLFARSPPEIKSPHESAGWSITRYSTWLEDHPADSDRLQLIQGALESYVASTRLRKEKSFAFPYNIMLGILKSASS